MKGMVIAEKSIKLFEQTKYVGINPNDCNDYKICKHKRIFGWSPNLIIYNMSCRGTKTFICLIYTIIVEKVET